MQLMHGQTLWLNDKHFYSLFGRSRALHTDWLVVTRVLFVFPINCRQILDNTSLGYGLSVPHPF
jgi:predicted ABC-type sugar transport system permease subunit